MEVDSVKNPCKTVRMDDLDRQLIGCLLEDGRASYAAIGTQIGLSAPAVKRRMDRLVSDGVIGESGPGAAWEGDRDTFVVVLYGSSSCAPIPTALTVDDEHSLALRFAESPGDVCSADMAANTFRFDTPDGLAADGEVELAMTFEHDGDTTVETVPILG